MAKNNEESALIVATSSRSDLSCLPVNQGSNGWLGPTTQSDNVDRLTSNLCARWVVIGGGFSGVAAARRLAERSPQDEVVLIDAAKIAHGSAGRSSGFIVPIGHFSERSIEANRRIHQLGCTGIEALRCLVKRHSIDCQWNETGRLIGASTGRAGRKLARIKQVLRQIDAPFESIDRDSFFELTAMKGVLESIRQVDSVLVQPASLLRGLVKNLPANVRVLECSPVVEVSRDGRLVQGLEGEVRTEGILLTVNAHLSSFGLGRNRVFPIRTFASLATPIDVVDQFDPDEVAWGYTSAERIGSSFRRLNDGRYLVRNTAKVGLNPNHADKELRQMCEIHRRTLQRRFESLGRWEIDSTWSGTIGVSANSATLFGQLSERVFTVAGHNGHGIAHGTAAGTLLADKALGNSNPQLDDIQRMRNPTWIPSGRLQEMGVRATVKFLNWRFRGEL